MADFTPQPTASSADDMLDTNIVPSPSTSSFNRSLVASPAAIDDCSPPFPSETLSLAELDRLFFQFMNKICSNLDAKDAKGEPIHQALATKETQRLDDSSDFCQFKVRIQAFTNMFLEELAFQGYKIPMSKVRSYLRNKPFISRFNEDGKEAKLMGDDIWNIDARKLPEGGWMFRPFHRKSKGSPPSVAHVGLRWSSPPRIWDPQASRTNVPLELSSPALPNWLSWEDGILSGTPPPDARACDVTIEARYMQDGREEVLVQTFHINIEPMSGSETSFATSRRQSLTNEPRRVYSDSVLPQTSGTVPRFVNPWRMATESGDLHQAHHLPRTQSSLGQLGVLPAMSVATQDAQMTQALTSAAHWQPYVIAVKSPHDATGPQLQALAKQQDVRTATAQALDHESRFTGSHPDAVAPSSNVLVTASQQIVLQTSKQVPADLFYVKQVTHSPQNVFFVFCEDMAWLDNVVSKASAIVEDNLGFEKVDDPAEADLTIILEQGEVTFETNDNPMNPHIGLKLRHKLPMPTSDASKEKEYAEHVMRVIYAARNFAYHLHRKGTQTVDIRMELHDLESEFDAENHKWIRMPKGDNLIPTDPSYVRVTQLGALGMTIYNDTDIPLYLNVLHFDSSDLVIRAWSLPEYGSDGKAKNINPTRIDPPLLPRSKLTLGYGVGWASPWRFHLREDEEKHFGFFKVFYASVPANFKNMAQPTPFRIGASIPYLPNYWFQKYPDIWGELRVGVVQIR
ncbi:hypothetical protein BD410DRAFT_768888 [Rickenella mellea]|uniref:Uncharacterized protein n=1 Tax=Rickenella mellea TaxID=50990 RepID=A0A4Y7Q8P4_9AGAM|nr:hypothetical protein BD410DRAFT_768888 [Rickenella mellea]